MSALHQAALVGNGDVLNALIEYGATVDIADGKSK
jgi:ankyrin repeat protein